MNGMFSTYSSPLQYSVPQQNLAGYYNKPFGSFAAQYAQQNPQQAQNLQDFFIQNQGKPLAEWLPAFQKRLGVQPNPNQIGNDFTV